MKQAGARAVSLGRVLLFSAVLGGLGGVVLSSMRGRQVEKEREQADQKRERAQKQSARPKTYVLSDGRPSFADPEALKFLPEYPKAFITDLAENTVAQGVPLKAAMFITEDPLDTVIGWYEKELVKAGRHTVSQHWGDGAAYVGFYGEDRHMHTVSAMVSGSKTFVFLSNSDPEAFLKGAAQRPAELPALADLSGELTFSFAEPGMSRTTYLARLKGAQLEATARVYRAGLEQLGWQIEATEPAVRGKIHLYAKRGKENLSVLLTRGDQEDHVAVYAHLLGRR
jgi:hypothetical protein